MRARSFPICFRTGKSLLVPVLLLLLYPGLALATAEQDYREGVEFFKKGDYRSAIARFEAAEQNGMETAALFYNLGSAYYKIGDYEASKTYFTRVTAFPEKRALAEFNLGIIAVEQNDKAAALSHFEYTAANSENPRLVELAKLKIAGLKQGKDRWGAYLSAKFGYDDNISVTPDNIAAGVDDTFYNLYASADVVVQGKRGRGWLVDAAYFRLDFSDEDDFNQDFYTVGARNEHRFSRWDTIAHLKYGRSTFGDEDLQSFIKLDVLGARPLSAHAKILLQYRYDDFTSKNARFDYLEGWRQRAQVRYYRNTEKSRQQVYYELELNKRSDLVGPDFSYEYSPTRHLLGGKYTHKFSDRWYLTGDLSWRKSDFPASATVDRDDKRWALSALLDYRIDNTFSVKADVKYIDNDSTVDLYTYDKTVISLGLSKLF